MGFGKICPPPRFSLLGFPCSFLAVCLFVCGGVGVGAHVYFAHLHLLVCVFMAWVSGVYIYT